jgi:hypothetical protein
MGRRKKERNVIIYQHEVKILAVFWLAGNGLSQKHKPVTTTTNGMDGRKLYRRTKVRRTVLFIRKKKKKKAEPSE